MNSNEKFWLNNFYCLFRDYKVLPTENMTFNQQMNAVTRLVILVFLILLVFSFRESLIFLLISLLIIIILYCLNINNMRTTENYKSYTQFYSGQPTKLETNKNFVSENQALVGPPNPKTFIKPVVITPMYDIERQASQLNVPTGVNKRTAQFLGDSGYYIRDCQAQEQDIIQGNMTQGNTNQGYFMKENFIQGNMTQGNMTQGNTNLIEKYDNSSNRLRKWNVDEQTFPYRHFGKPYVDVNTACTYNPNNSKFGVPDNVAISPCEAKNPEYNEQIFTQYLQPHVYTKSEVVGFPSSNIGISFQEPQYPTVMSKDRYGITYTEKNPKTFDESSIIEPDPYSEYPTQDEIYDPRLTGYGSQDRSYIEPKIGQTRYMYKDIDAARRGNYFVRSNVDHLPFAQQTGIMPDVIDTNIYRASDQAYIDQNTQFRTELQQRLMSKRNQEMWQLRKYPLRRDQGGCKNIR